MADDAVKVEGLERVKEALGEGLPEILKKIGMTKLMTERSQIIAKVHGPFDDLPSLLAEEPEVRDAYVESMADLRVNELTRAEGQKRREQAQRGVTKAADKVMVAAVDALDLIDSGKFRNDVATAPWRLEEQRSGG